MSPLSSTISAIIPLHNGQRFIGHALASVASQTSPADEVIIVDDGSTDDGLAVVEQFSRTFPLKVIRKLRGGPSSARNLGIAQSTGSLVALLDQDDIWYPNHLRELTREFADGQSGSLGWTYSNLDEIDETGRLISRSVLDKAESCHPKLDLGECLRHDMFVLPSASLISRQAIDAVGGFDERLFGYEDDDLFMRLFSAGFRNSYVSRALSQWRVHAGRSAPSPHLSASLMIYARKLLDSYPDDVRRNTLYAHDIIIPRFVQKMTDAMRQALRVGDIAAADACEADIEILESHLNESNRRRVFGPDLLTTVVIPLYNGAQFIEEALDSVLRQTVPVDEIIVVDDGSIDEGPAIVARMAGERPIRLLTKPNGGQSSARNYGIRHAHGELIALLDQDDVWYPSHVEQLAAPFRERRDRPFGWAYSDMDEIDEEGELVTQAALSKTDQKHPKTMLSDCLRHDMFVLPSASMMSRRAFRAVGGFDERLLGYEDDDLFLRMFLAGFENVYLPVPLSKWRIYHKSSSYSPRMAISRAIYVKKLIERFPNNPDTSRYYVRDMIAPRFFWNMMSELRKAYLTNTKEQQSAAIANLRFIAGHLRWQRRLPLQYVFLPAMRVPLLARFIIRYRTIMVASLRKIMQVA
jgi:glycosyltransferase involved in cell wall biosynthesis